MPCLQKNRRNQRRFYKEKTKKSKKSKIYNLSVKKAKTILQRKQTKIDANLKDALKCPFFIEPLFHTP